MNKHFVLFILSFLTCSVVSLFVTAPLQAQGTLPECATIIDSTTNFGQACNVTPVSGATNCNGVTPNDWCCPGRNARVVGNTCQSDDPVSLPNENLTKETFDALNPLVLYSTGVEENLATPGGIISRVLRFAFPIAGLLLFVMLVWSGFEILSGATEKKSMDAGKQRATAAVIGFVLLFVSYWLVQIVEVIFGVTIF